MPENDLTDDELRRAIEILSRQPPRRRDGLAVRRGVAMHLALSEGASPDEALQAAQDVTP